jgi:ketosteroid isomerase-like protein
MDHAGSIRRLYDIINAGDVDGFGGLLAEDFVEHEQLPGLPATKAGTRAISPATLRRRRQNVAQ